MTVRKQIGALAAVLGGIDSLVFTGGIGERSAELRGEICEGLEHLGVGTGAVSCARRRQRREPHRGPPYRRGRQADVRLLSTRPAANSSSAVNAIRIAVRLAAE